MSDGPWKTFRIDEHPDYQALPKDRCTLTMVRGPTPGAIQPVADEVVLGRGEDLEARIDDRGMSRRHARVFRAVGEWAVEDLGSTNGTLVNGEKITRMTRLKDGDRIQLGEETVLRVSLHDADEAEAVQRLYDSAVRDPLTGIYNRRHFDDRLGVEHAYAVRHRVPLTLLLFDLDHFKRVNDEYGHPAGDAVLCAVSAAVGAMVRGEDLLARWGGEEFALLARGIDREGGAALAERVRATIETAAIDHEGIALRVTASVGVATMDADHVFERPEALLAAADRAAYQAKADGRNRISVGT